MRLIPFETVVSTVTQQCTEACHALPKDVRQALENALRTERSDTARDILTMLLENADLSQTQNIPLCQDTGLTVVFVEQGVDVAVTGTSGVPLIDAIQEGVKQGYKEGFLRNSIVSDPLNGRKNTQSNLPAVIHLTQVPGDTLTISVMAKGGGCENKSQFRMFLPTASQQEVMDWVVDVATSAGANACPPLVVGVGIGGNFEVSCLLSKQSLMQSLDQSHPDPYYADMGDKILSQINASGVGPQGLGGDTTALGVCIATAPCHIASLPVAVNIECHSHRHKTAVL